MNRELIALVYAPDGYIGSRITHEEMLDYINNYKPQPTDHSTLPSHIEFMKRVVAYDLPIGFFDAYDDMEFWTQLMHDADWTSLNDPYFVSGTCSKPAMPSLIDSEKMGDAQTQIDLQALKNGKR